MKVRIKQVENKFYDNTVRCFEIKFKNRKWFTIVGRDVDKNSLIRYSKDIINECMEFKIKELK